MHCQYYPLVTINFIDIIRFYQNKVNSKSNFYRLLKLPWAPDDKTRLHLAYDSSFQFDKPVKSDIGVKINDYKDIVVDKLLTFFGRKEPRDTIEKYVLCPSQKNYG